VDLKGWLVGINTAILAPTGGNVGIGFAIPANMVREILAELIEHGEVRRGHLGLTVQGMNVELARAFEVDRRDGVIVTAVEPDSPAAAAGIRVGDVLVGLGERTVRTEVDYRARAAVVMVGDRLDVRVRRDGRERRLELVVPPDAWEKIPGRRLHPALSGTVLQTARVEGAEEEAGEDGVRSAGVRILEVTEGSNAWRVGLRAGDRIVAANGETARNLSDLTAGIKRSPRRSTIRIRRNGAFYDVRLPR
jgi:S1-C subfamily serine protease